MSPSYEKMIVLCATQRCGSTMVVEDMRSTGLLGVPEEYFIPWDVNKEGIDWVKQFVNVMNTASTENGVTSVKIMANQIPAIEECLKKATSSELTDSSGLFPHFKHQFQNAKYVFIRRDSVVRQAISRGMSRQTGINHATAKASDEHFAGNLMKGYKSEYNAKAKYDKSTIDQDVLAIVKENLVWESFFNSWGITHPLALRYEEICKNSPGYLQRIANYCDVDLPEGQMPTKRNMVKLSNGKNDDWCNQYLGNTFKAA